MSIPRTASTEQLIFINVFTVLPENQDRLLEILTHVTDEFVRHAPGFISSTLHRGLDGDKVTMYAIWESEESYMAMRGDPGPAAYLQEAMTIAKFEPGRYEVARTFIGARSLPKAPVQSTELGLFRCRYRTP